MAWRSNGFSVSTFDGHRSWALTWLAVAGWLGRRAVQLASMTSLMPVAMPVTVGRVLHLCGLLGKMRCTFDMRMASIANPCGCLGLQAFAARHCAAAEPRAGLHRHRAA